jgi:thiol peroxidase
MFVKGFLVHLANDNQWHVFMTGIKKSIGAFTLFFLGLAGILIPSVGLAQTTGTAITLGGKTIHTVGKLPPVGTSAKEVTLTGIDLKDNTLTDYKGKYVIMNIFPSVNTGVCSKSVRKFNEDAAGLQNTTVLCISKDLPFAQKAFCGAEGIKNVVMLSDFRTDFGHAYGVQIADGPMKGLLSRAVIVVNPEGKIVYEQQVPEIGQEPDYAAALAAVK